MKTYEYVSIDIENDTDTDVATDYIALALDVSTRFLLGLRSYL